ncbi:MAG: prepilin-type N-terminal cleavage/methylation domain-containing protein [Candidatus Saccharimonas sp.]
MRNKRSGFTIVELLVVIVLIAILVTVTIVTFIGISQRAHITAVKSDLSNAAKSLTMSNAVDGTYPPDLASAALKPSGDTTYQYTYTSATNSYCLTAISDDIAYMISTTDSSATAGVCPGHTGPSVPGVNGGGVTTLAGSFNAPYGVATDSADNIYVADYGNNRIRKITQAGIDTVLAGTGVSGFANGAGVSAQFNHPQNLDVDSAGNVYVADYGNNRIRKITPAGVVSTLAGSGVAGFADGAGGSAQFNYPGGIAVDSSGIVYVADKSNHRIRKITSAGVVSTLAGSGVAGFADGAGGSAQFYNPSGVAVDSSGNIYVADRFNNRIRKIQ